MYTKAKINHRKKMPPPEFFRLAMNTCPTVDAQKSTKTMYESEHVNCKVKKDEYLLNCLLGQNIPIVKYPNFPKVPFLVPLIPLRRNFDRDHRHPHRKPLPLLNVRLPRNRQYVSH